MICTLDGIVSCCEGKWKMCKADKTFCSTMCHVILILKCKFLTSRFTCKIRWCRIKMEKFSLNQDCKRVLAWIKRIQNLVKMIRLIFGDPKVVGSLLRISSCLGTSRGVGCVKFGKLPFFSRTTFCNLQTEQPVDTLEQHGNQRNKLRVQQWHSSWGREWIQHHKNYSNNAARCF